MADTYRRYMVSIPKCAQKYQLAAIGSSIYIVSTSGSADVIIEFRKWGNSLAVRIPKALADAIKASDGKPAEMKVENGTLVLRPIVKPARKPRYTLEELLSGMTRANVPQEIDWGPRRSNEAW